MLALAGTGAASAQPVDPEPSARLVLSAIDGLLGPATVDVPEDAPEELRLRLLVENDGTSVIEDATVVVEVHPAVRARSVLHAALDDGVIDTASRSVTTVDLRDGEPLPPGDIASLDVRVAGADAGWIGADGVYPVEVSVVRGTAVLDRVVTAAVHLSTVGVPVATAVVWPLSARPQRGADGSYPIGADAVLGPGGPVDAQVTAAEHVRDRAITLAPSAALLEELADRADGFRREDGTAVPDNDPVAEQAAALLQRVRRLIDNALLDPVVGAYAGVDVAALASGPPEVAELAVTAVALSQSRTQELSGRAPTLRAYAAATPLTPATLDALPIEHLLLPYGHVQGPALATNPDLPRADRTLRSAAGRVVTATVADPHVAAILAAPPTGAVVAGQRLVAETAMFHLEAPNATDRVLLVMPDPGWEPTSLAAIAELESLVDLPWLRTVGPGDLARTAGAEPSALTRLAASLPSSFSSELSSARRLLDALRAALPDATDSPSVTSLRALGDALLRAATPEALADGGTVALEQIRQIVDVVESGFGEVDVPDDLRVTLASASGEIPVTIQRPTGGDIRVLVEVDSVGRLTWEEDARVKELLLPAGSSRTVSFLTTAVSRGTFPVTVSVWDPTRTRLLDSATLSVRATAISGPALLGVGIVVVLLLLAGRRRRRPRLAVVDREDDPAATTDA